MVHELAREIRGINYKWRPAITVEEPGTFTIGPSVQKVEKYSGNENETLYTSIPDFDLEKAGHRGKLIAAVAEHEASHVYGPNVKITINQSEVPVHVVHLNPGRGQLTMVFVKQGTGTAIKFVLPKSLLPVQRKKIVDFLTTLNEQIKTPVK